MTSSDDGPGLSRPNAQERADQDGKAPSLPGRRNFSTQPGGSPLGSENHYVKEPWGNLSTPRCALETRRWTL